MLIRWIITSLFGLLSLFFLLGNPIAAWLAMKRERSYSVAGFVGGLAGVVSILALPLGTWQTRMSFAWIPLVLDYSYALAAYFLVWHCLLGRPIGGTDSDPDDSDQPADPVA
jgi:hypothetical protein